MVVLPKQRGSRGERGNGDILDMHELAPKVFDRRLKKKERERGQMADIVVLLGCW